MPFTISDTFDCTGETLTVAEDVLFNGGTSTLQNSIWHITGNLAAQTGVTFASNSFNGSNWLVSGTFIFSGASGNLLNLVATAPWVLTVAGTGVASYVNVAYSNASAGSTIFATLSTDSNNNHNWSLSKYCIQQAIYSILTADSILEDYKIYPNVVRQGRALPFIDYNLVTSTTEHNLINPITITEDLLNFHVFSTSYAESISLGNAIETALDQYVGTINGLQILNCVILDSLDMSEAPEDGTDHWIYHRVIRIKTYSK